MVVYIQLKVYDDQHFLFFFIVQYREIQGSHVGERRTRDWERTISRDFLHYILESMQGYRLQHQHFLNIKKKWGKGFQALFPQIFKHSLSLSVSLYLQKS